MALEHDLERIGVVARDQLHQLLVGELSELLLGIDARAPQAGHRLTLRASRVMRITARRVTGGSRRRRCDPDRSPARTEQSTVQPGQPAGAAIAGNQEGEPMSYEINLTRWTSTARCAKRQHEVAGDTRLSFLKKAGTRPAARRWAAARSSRRSPRARSPATQKRTPAREVRQGRHRHPQLRADARVPGGRVLQRRDRGEPVARARRRDAFLKIVTEDENAHVEVPQEGARLQGRQGTEVQLQRRQHERGNVHEDR